MDIADEILLSRFDWISIGLLTLIAISSITMAGSGTFWFLKARKMMKKKEKRMKKSSNKQD